MQHEFLDGKRKERKKKKKMLATHRRYDDYTRRTGMKRRQRQIKWHGGITFSTTGFLIDKKSQVQFMIYFIPLNNNKRTILKDYVRGYVFIYIYIYKRLCG